MSQIDSEHKPQPIVFIDDAHTFGGAQIALAWAIRAVLHRLHQPVVCVCTPATWEAIQQITGGDQKLRFIECSPALPLNLFTFPLRLRSLHKLLVPLAREGLHSWWLNLSGIEFCLAPLFILRRMHLRPIAWLHNTQSFLIYSAGSSTLRKLVSRIRDAMANRWLFALYPLILTPSRASESVLMARCQRSRPSRTGFLHPYVGLQNWGASHQSEEPDAAGQKIDLWMIGRVEYSQKNNRVALDVLKQLLASGKPASLTVVGEGVDMAQFRISIDEMGLSKYVTLMGWIKNPWQSIHDRAIVFMPSTFEGMPLVATEALLRGVRLVTSPIPAFYEGTPHEFVASDFSVETFTTKIEEVSSMSRERVLMLYAKALQQFTEDAFLEKFKSFCRAEQMRNS